MINEAMRAISEPRRRAILQLVRGREMTAGEIRTHFDVTGPAISQHLRVLVECGLATVRKEGTRRFYRARPEGLEELRRYLSGFWDEGLASLAVEAEIEQQRRNAIHPVKPKEVN